MNDPEVLAMFNELAEMKYRQYLAEEKAEKKMATAAAQGDAKAQNNTDAVFGLHRIKTWQLLSKS